MNNNIPPAAGPGIEPPAEPQDAASGGAINRMRRFASLAVSAAKKLILNRWTLGIAGIGLVLLVVAWFAGMPPGELRLASFQLVAEDDEQVRLATSIFHRADAAVADAERYHRQLSFAVGANAYNVAVPPPAGPRASDLRTFVPDLSIETSGEIGEIDFAITYNARALLEKFYEWFGLTDYFVVIHDLQHDTCANGTTNDCWRMVAQYWPSKSR